MQSDITLGELLQEPYQRLKQEGVKVHFDLWHGDFVDAKEAEECIKRLYLHIEQLTTAYEEVEK